ncbi:hypothetical protein BUALT_Bualt02G0026600 [Buddleja alternifolia]|uniref:Alkyl transferase n=1 Tax=Buddleja alternifolia TaxID=168488 RepID=A0AAV6Y7Q8_9LAMI|nr:hypothetical protein BUALT_Bualt02G0026600 [Buddleja alternifolia]
MAEEGIEKASPAGLKEELLQKHMAVMTAEESLREGLKAELLEKHMAAVITAEEALPEGLKAELMPKHVAVIMDGNRRWARERGMAVEVGHREGRRVMAELARLSSLWGIKVLSVFAFSTENWTRPREELEALMSLYEEVVTTYGEEDFERHNSGYNARVSFMGDRSKLPESLVEKMNIAEEKTKANKGLHIIIGLNYSGRYDIMQATRSIVSKVKDGILQIEDINEKLISEEMETNCAEFPVPDLLIRTSGEQRISNFMLWQLAYTELYFAEKKFPEFEEEDYVEALISFQKRDRRFGGMKYK